MKNSINERTASRGSCDAMWHEYCEAVFSTALPTHGSGASARVRGAATWQPFLLRAGDALNARNASSLAESMAAGATSRSSAHPPVRIAHTVHVCAGSDTTTASTTMATYLDEVRRAVTQLPPPSTTEKVVVLVVVEEGVTESDRARFLAELRTSANTAHIAVLLFGSPIVLESALSVLPSAAVVTAVASSLQTAQHGQRGSEELGGIYTSSCADDPLSVTRQQLVEVSLGGAVVSGAASPSSREPQTSKTQLLTTQAAAVTYLQQHTHTPFVLTASGLVGAKLAVALAVEVAQLASSGRYTAGFFPVLAALQAELGFLCSPLTVLAHHGVPHLTQLYEQLVRQKEPADGISTWPAASTVEDALNNVLRLQRQRAMSKAKAMLTSPSPLPATMQRDVDGVFFALLNQCCLALLHGEVLCVEDVNALSVVSLALRLTTGGVLAMADVRAGGLGDLLAEMDQAGMRSKRPYHGLALLEWMHERGLSFARLTPEHLAEARRTLQPRA